MIFKSKIDELMFQIKAAELDQIDQGLTYSEDRVKVSIVHGREDVALIALYLENINKRLSEIALKCTIAVCILGIFFLAFVCKEMFL